MKQGVRGLVVKENSEKLSVYGSIRKRRELLTQMLSEPETFAEILEFVADGGSLIDWCRDRNLPHARLMAWIRAEPDRDRKYAAALRDRKEHMFEIVVAETLALVQFDIRDLYDDQGNIKNIRDMPRDVARSLSSIEVEELFSGSAEDRQVVGTTKKIKLIDRLKSIEMLGRHTDVQAWKDRLEHTGKITLEELVAGSRADKPDSAD